jgi:photosystem II stability/assembly factor-like uncharacterized protein
MKAATFNKGNAMFDKTGYGYVAAAAVLVSALLAATFDAGAQQEAPIQGVVGGTAHEALFGVAHYGRVAVAVGGGGAILESGDGGRSWKAAPKVPMQLALFGVALQQGHAIAVGQDGAVLVMNEEGHWLKVDSGTTSRLLGVGVNAAGVAAAVGSFGTIIRSADGGQTWTSVAPDWAAFAADGMQPHLYAASVDEAGTITVAGEFGLILRSADGGAHWQLLHKGDASLFALDLSHADAGFAVGQNGTVLRTTDHGATWSQAQTDSQAILLGVCAAGDGRVVATGIREMLESKDGGKTWKRAGDEKVTASWYAGATAVDRGDPVIAVGSAGQVIRIGG